MDKKIEQKWQKRWQESGVNSFKFEAKKEKKYVLEMFSYPSAANLHIGHWFNFGVCDSYARYLRMRGYNVFQPMGFDSFGLPAENYAIKTGIHPKDSTEKNISIMEKQLMAIGAMYDWDYQIVTSRPEYYKWTQWLFLQLYKNNLAYRKNAPVNFCPSCQTVIANEQVDDGCCERCHSEVERRGMTQWFFKISDYAERLLEGHSRLDWPQKTIAMQKNWIGKSEGALIRFMLEKGGDFEVYTTRADTLCGVSYVVLAPEHPLVNEITTKEQAEAVSQYKLQASKTSEIERLSAAKGKTGVFTGAYCINPATGQKVPVWIADYCLYTYGTGAVMGVPAHDTRDYEFAKIHGLEIKRVIKSADGSPDGLPFTNYGVLVNSGAFDNLSSVDAKTAIIEELEKKGAGAFKTNYRIRDWSVSRQRYWGAPIPIIYCDKCGTVPVPEKDLPVLLPYNVNFTPDGQSPLAKSEEFVNCVCPSCGGAAKRESDTLDTFVCSSWYYLRYPDANNTTAPFSRTEMLPVDKYIGGPEHACGHLLYARFITKVLYDLGFIDFDEPFTSLVHQGIILGPDGMRMSKSHGNVVNPDIYVNEYGADVFRMYLMFGFDYTEGGPWSDEGIKAVSKFLQRVERIAQKVEPYSEKDCGGELDYALNYCIKQVGGDIEKFSFNTAVARLMELTNALYQYENSADCDYGYLKHIVHTMVYAMAPLTPHFAEELNLLLGGTFSVFDMPYPVCDESKLVKNNAEIAVQVNSRIRCRMEIAQGLTDDEVIKLVLSDAKVTEILDNAAVKKVIVIKNRLVNIII